MRIIFTMLAEGRTAYAIFYDLDRKCIVNELTDYFFELTGEGLSPLTISQQSRYLARFWEFLIVEQNKHIEDVDDELIVRFRDSEFYKTLASNLGRRDENMAKATTNAKLHRIYHWLHWLAVSGRVGDQVVGPLGQVKSAIALDVVSQRGQRNWRRRQRISCPLAFRVPGAKSKHKMLSEVPDEHTVDEVQKYFFERQSDSFTSHRNSLIVDIANATGLRRGSICSLLVKQFAVADIDAAQDEYWIKPPKQKFSYVNSFPVPLHIAHNVRHFIDRFLLPHIRSRGYGSEVHGGHIFISETTGKPLKERSVTKLVSSAMRHTGFGRGTSLHSFRSKFAQEEIESETLRRLEMGLDTSARSIAQAAAMKLGHRNWESLFPYAVAAQSSIARTERTTKDAELDRLRTENRSLRARLAQPKRGSDVD